MTRIITYFFFEFLNRERTDCRNQHLSIRKIKIFICPIFHHTDILDDPATPKFFPEFFLFDIIWQVLDKKTFAPNRDSWLFLLYSLLAFGWLNNQISTLTIISTLLKGIVVICFVIKFDVGISSASARILIFWELDLYDSRVGAEEFNKTALVALIWDATNKYLIDF